MIRAPKKSFSIWLMVLVFVDFCASTLLGAQARPPAQTKEPSMTSIQLPWKELSPIELKLFLNDVFLTALQVSPELRAAGLRQLASIIAPFDTRRAIWVYDQAFRASEMVPYANKLALREQLQKEIILDEAQFDLAQAVDHALRFQPPAAAEDSASSPPNGKVTVLLDLIHRIPPQDMDGLFQKLVSPLVREDEYFEHTLALIHSFQQPFPNRTLQLFSEALLQFQIRPPEARLLRSFIMLTIAVASNHPASALTAADLLLKKADQMDLAETKGKSSLIGAPATPDGAVGPNHVSVISQLYPVMKKLDPAIANEWAETLQDRRNLLRMASPSPQLTAQANTPSGDAAKQKSTPANPNLSKGSADGDAGAQYNIPMSASSQPRANPPVQSPERRDPPSVVAPGVQPGTAFSLALTKELAQLQSASNNDPEAFSARLDNFLPRVEAEGDPRAQSAALSQIGLAFLKMGDPDRAQHYIEESLRRGRDGDFLLLTNVQSPSLFFSAYCATANAISQLALQYPMEAMTTIKSIPDTQLRLRVMIDTARLLSVFSSITLSTPTKPN